MNSRYVNGSLEPRVTGGSSLHDKHTPGLCGPFNDRHVFRCVDCCERKPERDIVECQVCGLQTSVKCSFDEDFS